MSFWIEAKTESGDVIGQVVVTERPEQGRIELTLIADDADRALCIPLLPPEAKLVAAALETWVYELTKDKP